MLLDETCWFLVVDFDKETWKEDSSAYLEICETFNVPAVLERSRSGNGGHIWIFFSEPIPAKLARQLGAFMLTQAMEWPPSVGTLVVYVICVSLCNRWIWGLFLAKRHKKTHCNYSGL